MTSIYHSPGMHTAGCYIWSAWYTLSSSCHLRFSDGESRDFNLHSNLWHFPITRRIWARRSGSILLLSISLCKATVMMIQIKLCPLLPLPSLYTFPPPPVLSVFLDKTADNIVANNNKTAISCSLQCHRRPRREPSQGLNWEQINSTGCLTSWNRCGLEN